MKVYFTLAGLIIAFYCNAQNISDVRRLYNSAGTEEDSARKLNEMLAGVTERSEAVMQCYKGAVTMVQAKYFINPFKKYKYFANGKKLVEGAIAHDTMNAEMRYVRLTLQSNIPSFLGYNKNIEPDKAFLYSHISALTDVYLKNCIMQYLYKTKYSLTAK